MIHVVIPVHNRLEFTKTCLISLRNQKKIKNLNIIVIDDGSNDGTFDYLTKNFTDITILKSDGSLFWCGAVNYGISHILKIYKTGDWVLLINNDVQLNQDSIIELIKISEKKNRKVLTGALTLSLKDKKTVIKSGTIVKSWFLNRTKHVFEGINYENISNYEPVNVDFLTARCLLHPIEMILEVGNYDSKTFIHYGGDDEFSMRIKKFGYSSFLCPTSFVFLNDTNSKKYEKNFFKNLYFTLFSKRSSSNLINKLLLTKKIVPAHAKITYFLIGILKSIYIFFKNEIYK